MIKPKMLTLLNPISTMNILLTLSLFLTLSLLHLSASATAFPTEALPTKSGYLRVNPSTNSSIFYTFYEAQKPTLSLSQTPLLIWLQGGPGCSSMLGNFFELGPWHVSLKGSYRKTSKNYKDHYAKLIKDSNPNISSLLQKENPISLVPNPASWNRLFGLVFLDNPIGVGFSIASKPDEIPTDQKGVSKHLFEAFSAFLAQNRGFKTRPVYVTGESYAGKYVPAFGYYVLRRNPRLPESKRINLAGIAIGNGLTDPITQVSTHAVNGYYLGLINEKQKALMEKLQDKAVDLTKKGNWSEAADARNKVLKMLENTTGLATLYDFRRLVPYQTSLVAKFLSQKEAKRALGVDETTTYEECSDIVKKVLHGDVMKSAKYMVEYLVKNSKVLLYQGQCDLRDGVVSTEAWVKKMKWEGISMFLESERDLWRVNGKLAGYVQKGGNLTNVVVLGAGHLVPTDQGLNSQAMIEDWVLSKGLFGDKEIQNLYYSDSPGAVGESSFGKGEI